MMLFGIDVIIIAPGAVKTPIWDKAEEVDISVYRNSPYFPALEKIRAYMLHLERDRLAAGDDRRSDRRCTDVAKPQGALSDHARSDAASGDVMCCPGAPSTGCIAKRLGLTPQP